MVIKYKDGYTSRRVKVEIFEWVYCFGDLYWNSGGSLISLKKEFLSHL